MMRKSHIRSLALLLLLALCSLLFVVSITASRFDYDDNMDVDDDEDGALWSALMAILHDEPEDDEDYFATSASMATVRCVTASALNVRAGRGTNFKVVGSLSMGQKVEVTNVQNGWAQIGNGRFVSNTYLGACGGGGGGSAKGLAASNYARKQVGKCYSQDVNKRRGPSCFDCSGLVNKAWELQGVTVPWTTHTYPTSNMIRVSPSNVQAGDVLYRSGHVGMYVGNGEVVHAANTKQGVIKVSFSSFRYETIYRPRL